MSMQRIVLALFLSVFLLHPSAGRAQPVVDHGGPIISQPRILPIFWGPTPNQVAITSFYQAAIQRVHWLSYDYGRAGGIANGTVLAPVTITPTHGSATDVQWTDIQNQLSELITSGAVPPQDTGLIYAFHFPPTVNIWLTWSGARMCGNGAWGEHGSFSPWSVAQGGPGPGTQFPWITVVPTCGSFDSVTYYAYHELLEEITNPETGGAKGYTNAWYTNNYSQEIADVCQSSSGALVTASDGTVYQVAYGYSNYASLCTAPEPQLQDPYGTHIMAGHAMSQCMSAGGVAIPNATQTSITATDSTGGLSFSIGPSSPCSLSAQRVNITAALNSPLGAHHVYFTASNGGTVVRGSSFITVDACVPHNSCTSSTGGQTLPDGCGGSVTCPCAAGLTNCGGTCVDTSSSNQNCGACGYSCRSVAFCSAGTCTCNSAPKTCPRNYYWDDTACRCSQ